MRLVSRAAIGASVVLALSLSVPAGAFILDDGGTKNAGKWRSDLQKQTNKTTDCVTKAVLSCEKKTLRTTLQCDPSCDADTGTGGNLNLGGTGACVDPDHPEFASIDQDFRDDLNGCAASFDPNKKAFDYDGDNDPGSLGDQPALACSGDCSGDDGTQLDATACGGTDSGSVTTSWTTAVAGPEGTVRETLALFDLQFQIICGAAATVTCQDPKGKVEGVCTGDGTTVCTEDADCTVVGGTCDKSATVGLTCTTTGAGGGEISFVACDDANGECIGNTEDEIDCANDAGKILSKMVSKVNKAAQKCEEDFKDKAGNGGPTDVSDTTNCNVTFAGDGSANAGNPDIVAEINGAHADLAPWPNAQLLLPTVAGGLLDATSDAYNSQIDLDNDGAGDGSPPLRGDLAPVCGSCGDGTIDYGEQCEPGGGSNPVGCGVCPSTSNFLTGQAACQCPNL